MDSTDEQERLRQEQAERDFIAAREQLAAQDVAERAGAIFAEPGQPERDDDSEATVITGLSERLTEIDSRLEQQERTAPDKPLKARTASRIDDPPPPPPPSPAPEHDEPWKTLDAVGVVNQPGIDQPGKIEHPGQVDTVWIAAGKEGLTEKEMQEVADDFRRGPEGLTSGPRDDDPPPPYGPNSPEPAAVERSEPPSPSPETPEMCHSPADIDAGERFRMAADTTTSTPWGRLERDIAERIAMLEVMTGMENDPAHRAFVVEQKDIGERISATADPAERAELRREKDAHSQTYAADLCNVAYAALWVEARHADANAMRQEAALRQEIARDLREPDPEHTRPEKAERDPSEIKRDMADASGLGPTAYAAAVVEGPSIEEQRGQLPDPHAIRSEAGRNDYADLRAATVGPIEQDDRPKTADYGLNIRAVMEVSPEGTYIASRPQSSLANQETDYENGPSRPGATVAIAALAATQHTANEDHTAEDERIAASSERDKREVEDKGKIVELSTPARGDTDVTFKSAAERNRDEIAQAEMAVSEDRDNSRDTGRSGMGGGGRGL